MTLRTRLTDMLAIEHPIISAPMAFAGGGKLAVAPTAALSCAIYQDATQIGTLDFAAGSTAGTFTFDQAIQFNAGNTLRVMRPAALDETALDLSILFAAVKGTL